MEPVSTTQLADVWQARLDHWGRLLLLPLLAAATGLAAISVAGGYGTWSRFDHGLVVVSAAAAWSAMHTCRPRPARTERARAATVAIHITLAGLLVWVNPWYGVFAFSGYFFADDLRGRWRWAGFAATALVLAGSQAGGYPTDWSGHTVIYVVMVAVNLVAVSGFITLTNRVLEQNQQRGQMIDELADTNRRLEATMAENAGLHAQLLVQAREAGVVEERQRLAGEIHDTLAQGLAGIVAQLEAAEQARGHPVELSRHLTQARALARSSLTEARRSVRALRPEQLERASLPEAIDELSPRLVRPIGGAGRCRDCRHANPARPSDRSGHLPGLPRGPVERRQARRRLTGPPHPHLPPRRSAPRRRRQRHRLRPRSTHPRLRPRRDAPAPRRSSRTPHRRIGPWRRHHHQRRGATRQTTTHPRRP